MGSKIRENGNKAVWDCRCDAWSTQWPEGDGTPEWACTTHRASQVGGSGLTPQPCRHAPRPPEGAVDERRQPARQSREAHAGTRPGRPCRWRSRHLPPRSAGEAHGLRREPDRHDGERRGPARQGSRKPARGQGAGGQGRARRRRGPAEARQIDSELVRERYPSRSESFGRWPCAFILWSSFCVPIAAAANTTCSAVRVRVDRLVERLALVYLTATS